MSRRCTWEELRSGQVLQSVVPRDQAGSEPVSGKVVGRGPRGRHRELLEALDGVLLTRECHPAQDPWGDLWAGRGLPALNGPCLPFAYV